jgi:hypothetical protein
MKVALLLSGLARKVEEGYNEYWKHVIENNDVDVYLHYWEDAEYERVLDFYQPKKHICEKPVDFNQYKVGVVSPNDPLARPVENYNVAGNYYSLPMIYGWQQVYNLIGGEYDLIIRSRYDLGWESPLNLDKVDPNYINVSNQHWPNNEILDDNLTILNQKLGDKLFKNIFNDFVTLIQNRGIINFAEKNYTDLILEKDLYKYITKNNNIQFKLLREFKVWY